MKRPLRRPLARTRSALASAEIPTWNGPRAVPDRADALRFVAAPGRLPDGRRVYAIGDVHGSLDQLRALHAAVTEDLHARPVPSAVLVHLGDYIDHGADSAGVLSLLCAGTDLPDLRVVNLLGEHERMLLDSLDGDRAAATDWLWSGGKATLASWGLDPDLPREQWRTEIPAEHVAFLRGLALSHREGEYLFVHAGIRPGVPLARQTRDDLLGIRQPFLWSEQDFGFVVVHGHSANPAPVTLANRIGLDTGAGLGGKLSCAVLEADRLALLAV
ncbi:MAG TPA: metallophosphoesterase [Acetobacteraceae bacterium]|nr:metallophosphoesterase [Acetobacteraceae bacterium]